MFDHVAASLAPFGFVPIGREFLHRKTWNTNRGVAFATLPSSVDLAYAVEQVRAAARVPLKHSWFGQLGLQIVFDADGPPPPVPLLAAHIDRINHQGILVQSIFAIHAATGERTEARTWGQVVTGKYQDAIAAALAACAGA